MRLKFSLDQLLREYKEDDVVKPLKSFDLQKTLNPIVWDKNDKIKPEIRKDLMNIAQDVFDSLEVNFAYDDIILTGSLANYNWSDYSDFDLHILIDYRKINSDVELVAKYLGEFKKNWNSSHDIRIHGFDVEIYVQDNSEAHISTGFYSILHDEWDVKPNPFTQKIDKESIRVKALGYMEEIDELEKLYDTNRYDYKDFHDRLGKVWTKIRHGRQAGLAKDGELSVENLVFKMLRRNEYIQKVIDLKAGSYDRAHSMG